MLAYVFWHWPADAAGAADYEESLRRFHEAMAMHGPDGFVSSASFRVSPGRWVSRETAYEDWYLVTDYDALGNLNDAAVSGARSESHNAAAALAAGGTGGLYRALVGEGRLAPVRWGAWMSKPKGMPYPEFFDSLAHFTARPDITLWQRQLTLGPATEFCLHAVEKHELPEAFQPVWVELAPAWIPS